MFKKMLDFPDAKDFDRRKSRDLLQLVFSVVGGDLIEITPAPSCQTVVAKQECRMTLSR
jgi:hypothetical protein